MNRNLPISSRISVDVQQLFEDLIVVKCNVNNKEFQGILLNTSKSFFGINESRLKSGPEGLSMNETDKGNVSFSCSVERYSYKLDGTGPNIFTRHPVKRHKTAPTSGKHVICHKCQSVVTIPDQVEDKKQPPDNGVENHNDEIDDSNIERSHNRRKSHSNPKRISNFDTRENFESSYFAEHDKALKMKLEADSPACQLGSNISRILPSSSLLDVKKILKKKKKKDRLKEKTKTVNSESKSPKSIDEVKEKIKKRKLEADAQKVPVKKCKLLDFPYQSHSNRDSIEKPSKASKRSEEQVKKDSGKPLNSSGTNSSRESGQQLVDTSVPLSKTKSRSERDESAMTSASHSKLQTDDNHKNEKGSASQKESSKSLKRLKKDNLIDKKAKKKKKTLDKYLASPKGNLEEPISSASQDNNPVSEETNTRRSKTDGRQRPHSKSREKVSNPKIVITESSDTNSVTPIVSKTKQAETRETEPAESTDKESSKKHDTSKAEKTNVPQSQDSKKPHDIDSASALEKSEVTGENEVTSAIPESAVNTTNTSVEMSKKKSNDSNADSSLSLKIKINRTPSSDNGGYQCQIVGEDNHTVSSSTVDIQPPESDAGMSSTSVASASATSPEHMEASESKPDKTIEDSAEETYVERCVLPRGETFAVGDVVWAKITGYPWWPARVNVIRRTDRIESKDRVVTYTAEVLWFNWDQISFIPCEKLLHFLDHYKVKCDKKRKGMYRNAVEQAWMAAQTAQSIAEDDDDEDEVRFDSYGHCIVRPSSDGSISSQVSSSSITTPRNTPVNQTAPADSGSFISPSSHSDAPASSVSSTSVRQKLSVESNDPASRPSKSAVAQSHETRRRESSDDDSESGLVIDTELSGHGSL